MHELAATQRLLETALQQAQASNGGRITDVYLVVGQMSEMADEAVRFYWAGISSGTPAEGARLHFRHVPAEFLCLACNHRYAPAADDVACPECGSTRVKIVAGDEFGLEAIDVEPART
jgi:hydrogenase nickel incorporation protein HypA/HybF